MVKSPSLLIVKKLSPYYISNIDSLFKNEYILINFDD